MSNQDDSREISQKQLFGITDFSETGRSSGYVPDGYKVINNTKLILELKSMAEEGISKGKIVKKSGISTARGFGEQKVHTLRMVDAFLFSKHKGNDFDNNWMEHYILTYAQLLPILEEKVIKPYNEGRKPRKNSRGYFGVKEFEQTCLPFLSNLSPEDQDRLMHTIEVGASLNDPKIPWKYIQQNGTQIRIEKDLDDFLSKIDK